MRHRGEDSLRAMLRERGAVSPGGALPGKELPPVDSASFDRLLRAGVIREGAPGTYYLYEPPVRPARFVRQVLFFVALIALPIGMLEFCGRVQ
jgi:hypothetical protein